MDVQIHLKSGATVRTFDHRLQNPADAARFMDAARDHSRSPWLAIGDVSVHFTNIEALAFTPPSEDA